MTWYARGHHASVSVFPHLEDLSGDANRSLWLWSSENEVWFLQSYLGIMKSSIEASLLFACLLQFNTLVPVSLSSCPYLEEKILHGYNPPSITPGLQGESGQYA